MNLVPINSLFGIILGDIGYLPSATAWAPLLLTEGQELRMSQGDMSAAFCLFEMPDCWAPFMMFNYATDGSTIGREKGSLYRPCCKALPMGWSSSVGIMQQVSREILRMSGLPKGLELQKVNGVPP